MARRSRFNRWMAGVSGILALSLLVAACGGGDDATATPQAAAATQTPAAVAQATPTQAAAATATDEATAAAAPLATATATAAVEATSTPTSEATATASAPATATAGATETVVDEEDPFEEIGMLDPELLPNYTLTLTMEMNGVPGEPDEMVTEFLLDLEIQQSSLDNYHMRFDSGDLVVEVWVVDDTTYLRQEDGTIISSPGTDMSMFSPGLFLQTTPTLDPEMEASREGQEEVSGRETTRYRISAENYLAMSEVFEDGQFPDDASGEFVVWVDNELNIPMRYESDITWTNVEGSPGRIVASYLISNIGSTPGVEAPQ